MFRADSQITSGFVPRSIPTCYVSRRFNTSMYSPCYVSRRFNTSRKNTNLLKAFFKRLFPVSFLSAVFSVFVFCQLGCGSSPKTTKKLAYSATAKQNFRKGVKALNKKQMEEAKKFFGHVRSRYPLSKYAVLSKLRLADLLFKSGKFISAISAYESFLKDHPTHREVTNGYVPYRIGYAHFRMVPDDFFLFPPAYEKDLTPALATVKVFRSFLERFPNSKYSDKARRYFTKALKVLAKHELYVARFYLSRGKPKGAILRLQYIIAKYPEAGFEPSVMLLLGKTYLKLKQIERAKSVFSDLMKKHPKNQNASQAKLYIKHIKKRFGK